MQIIFFQAEDGIRDRSPSRGLGDVYKRQLLPTPLKFTLQTEKSFSINVLKVSTTILLFIVPPY